MQLSFAETIELTKKIRNKFKRFKGGTICVCPNFVSLIEIKGILDDTDIKLGAQDVFWEEKGAFTGEVSPIVLKEVGCDFVIIGHSERRKYMRENYEMVHKKIRTCLNLGLTPILCIGESWEERKTDRRDFVLIDQLQIALGGLDIIGNQQIVIAYEPIWAIGTGSAIERPEVEYAHKIIALALNQMFTIEKINKNFRIIYGGSISSRNVNNFIGIDNMDGLLVGGASLETEEFYSVASAMVK